VNSTLPADGPLMGAALRACADGFYPAEAAAELLIAHAFWLCLDDYLTGPPLTRPARQQACPNPFSTAGTRHAGNSVSGRNAGALGCSRCR
jgi:hypothetical protein